MTKCGPNECKNCFERAIDQPPVVEIHMADDIFIKQMLITKAGTYIPQHSHAYDHTSMLAVGSVRVWVDGIIKGDFKAPTGILIEKGTKHTFLSLEDNTIVYCIHNLMRSDAVEVLEEHHLVGGP